MSRHNKRKTKLRKKKKKRKIIRNNKKWRKRTSHHQLKDVVTYVAMVVANCVGRGVWEDYRRRWHVNGVDHDVMGHVRQVHHHAQPVHLLHHKLHNKQFWMYGCEIWSAALNERQGLQVFENRVPRKRFTPRREGVWWEDRDYNGAECLHLWSL